MADGHFIQQIFGLSKGKKPPKPTPVPGVPPIQPVGGKGPPRSTPTPDVVPTNPARAAGSGTLLTDTPTTRKTLLGT